MTKPMVALISVFDKSGLEPLASAFQSLGIEMVSSGGTRDFLRECGFVVRDLSDVTGFPEILDGRVKTLHPKIHGGLLARRDFDAHMKTLGRHDIRPLDILVCNLYPFEETRDSGAGFEACIEQIDIGGPAMIRAAAKNHGDVLVITSIGDYDGLIERLHHPDRLDQSYRRSLAQNAFSHTATYDAAVASWFAGQNGDLLPDRLTVAATRKKRLRYGENPHQAAAFYATSKDNLASAILHQGKELSYNNIADADAAWSLVQEFKRPSVAIIKHANPCGCATDDNFLNAYKAALKADPVSAFGGIVATNTPLDAAAAEAITEIFTEVVIAPAIEDDAKQVFAKKSNLRLLIVAENREPVRMDIRSVAGGLLLQEHDTAPIQAAHFKCVTNRTPNNTELADMEFAFKVARHVKSNAIVLARNQAVLGVGAGQMSRIDSVQIAAARAGTQGLGGSCVLASDAFFPFPDGLERALEAGVTAAVQPGGSRNDDDVIALADKAGITMMFTGQRHFWH